MVKISDARQCETPPTLNSMGFELCSQQTTVNNFRDDDEVRRLYYPEMEKLVKEATGASHVLVFDHTVRNSSLSNLNTLGQEGAAAASVARVHCDYTEDSAPMRVRQLAAKESYTGVKLDPDEVERLVSGRFTFLNCWRNIAEEPIETKPLAVCDTNSVQRDEHFLYELIYEDRVGLNYSLPYSEKHAWYYYPKMTKDEVLTFKVIR
jgi:hypothetical protein